MPIPYFNVPLNLPHAATVASRICRLLSRLDYTPAHDRAEELLALLEPCLYADDNPPNALALRDEAADRVRQLVEEIQTHGCGGDRLGQCVRNLFECLALGQEGARISLLAGENPNSLQRPG